MNGRDYPWTEGLTVQRLLYEKGFSFPLIVVTINGKPINPSDYSKTVIEDGVDVKAIHLIGGG